MLVDPIYEAGCFMMNGDQRGKTLGLHVWARENGRIYECVIVWNVGRKSEPRNEQVWETEKERETQEDTQAERERENAAP